MNFAVYIQFHHLHMCIHTSLTTKHTFLVEVVPFPVCRLFSYLSFAWYILHMIPCSSSHCFDSHCPMRFTLDIHFSEMVLCLGFNSRINKKFRIDRRSSAGKICICNFSPLKLPSPPSFLLLLPCSLARESGSDFSFFFVFSIEQLVKQEGCTTLPLCLDSYKNTVGLRRKGNDK